MNLPCFSFLVDQVMLLVHPRDECSHRQITPRNNIKQSMKWQKLIPFTETVFQILVDFFWRNFVIGCNQLPPVFHQILFLHQRLISHQCMSNFQGNFVIVAFITVQTVFYFNNASTGISWIDINEVDQMTFIMFALIEFDRLCHDVVMIKMLVFR